MAQDNGRQMIALDMFIMSNMHKDWQSVFPSGSGGHPAALQPSRQQAESLPALPAVLLPPPRPLHQTGLRCAGLRRGAGTPPHRRHPKPPVRPPVLQNPDPVLPAEGGRRTAQQVQGGRKAVACCTLIIPLKLCFLECQTKSNALFYVFFLSVRLTTPTVLASKLYPPINTWGTDQLLGYDFISVKEIFISFYCWFPTQLYNVPEK